MAIFNQFADIQNKSTTVDYSSFLQDVKNGSVQKVVIDGRVLTVLNSEGNKYVVYAPSDPWLVSDLLSSGVSVQAQPEKEPSFNEYICILVPNVITYRGLDILYETNARWWSWWCFLIWKKQSKNVK